MKVVLSHRTQDIRGAQVAIDAQQVAAYLRYAPGEGASIGYNTADNYLYRTNSPRAILHSQPLIVWVASRTLL